MHNFRNLPPLFLAVQYSQQVTWLEATTVLGKLNICNFGVLQAKPACAQSVTSVWKWLVNYI